MKSKEEDTPHIPNQNQDKLDAQFPRLLQPDNQNSPLNVAVADRTEDTQPNDPFESSSVIDFVDGTQFYPGMYVFNKNSFQYMHLFMLPLTSFTVQKMTV